MPTCVVDQRRHVTIEPTVGVKSIGSLFPYKLAHEGATGNRRIQDKLIGAPQDFPVIKATNGWKIVFVPGAKAFVGKVCGALAPALTDLLGLECPPRTGRVPGTENVAVFIHVAAARHSEVGTGGDCPLNVSIGVVGFRIIVGQIQRVDNRLLVTGAAGPAAIVAAASFSSAEGFMD